MDFHSVFHACAGVCTLSALIIRLRQLSAHPVSWGPPIRPNHLLHLIHYCLVLYPDQDDECTITMSLVSTWWTISWERWQPTCAEQTPHEIPFSVRSSSWLLTGLTSRWFWPSMWCGARHVPPLHHEPLRLSHGWRHSSRLSLELIRSLLELAEKVCLVGTAGIGPRLGLGLVQHRSLLVARGVLLSLVGSLRVPQIEEIQRLLGVERVDRSVGLRLRHCWCDAVDGCLLTMLGLMQNVLISWWSYSEFRGGAKTRLFPQ